MNPEDVDQSLSELIEAGKLEIVGVDKDGELTLKLTEAGIRYVEKEISPTRWCVYHWSAACTHSGLFTHCQLQHHDDEGSCVMVDGVLQIQQGTNNDKENQ